MTFTDKEKLKRLKDTFRLNFRLSQLYALYLENCPEAITKDTIALLCEGGEISEKDALCALVGELFGLDDARGGDDRRLLREYIRRSVRVLDVKDYLGNPYYKKIAPQAAKLDNWEIKWEKYPAYRAAVCDDMVMREDFTEYAPLGFFTEDFLFPAVLEDENEWMTLTPVDVDTVWDAINVTRGRVITFGLGLGYYTYMVSEREEVSSVTVVEKNEKVIRLFREFILPKFEHPEKVRIIHADAFRYAEEIMPSENYDFAFVDTWRDASDGLPMYEKMKALEHLSPNTEFSYWIENFILSRKRSLKFGELCDAIEGGGENAPNSYNEFIERLCE